MTSELRQSNTYHSEYLRIERAANRICKPHNHKFSLIMMITDEYLRVNKYAQDRVPLDEILNLFSTFTIEAKRYYLLEIICIIIQSRPKEEDIESAITISNLKRTYTPCVMIQKGIAQYQLERITQLPEYELKKSLILLLSLFKTAYKRRSEVEKNLPHKWWYWDLTDENIDRIRDMFEKR